MTAAVGPGPKRPIEEAQADPVLAWNALHPEFAFELVKTEYASLREESTAARAAQQAILQWTLAAVGTIFAAGLLLSGLQQSNGRSRASSGFLGSLVLLIFLGLAFSAALASFAWWGEVIRMERAGRYLRGLEKSLAGRYLLVDYGLPGSQPFGTWPLRWENYIARHSGQLSRGKQQIGYFGALGLFTGVVLASLLVFGLAAHAHQYRSHAPAWRAICDTLAAVLGVSYVVIVLTMRASLMREGRSAADLS